MSEDIINEKLIRITSSDKVANESNHNGDFVVYLKETSILQIARNIMIKEVQCANTFYNIRAGNGFVNNVFKMLETGQSDIFPTIPEGQYNISTFMTALQTAINVFLVGGTVAITQDPLTLKLVFTFTGTTAIIYDFEDGNQMASTVGITQTTSAPSALINADSLPDLSGISMVFFYSEDLSPDYMIDGDFGLTNSFESLSFHNVSFGNYGFKQSGNRIISFIKFTSDRNLIKIRIQLRDQYGNILDPGSTDVVVILKVFY